MPPDHPQLHLRSDRSDRTSSADHTRHDGSRRRVYCALRWWRSKDIWSSSPPPRLRSAARWFFDPVRREGRLWGMLEYLRLDQGEGPKRRRTSSARSDDPRIFRVWSSGLKPFPPHTLATCTWNADCYLLHRLQVGAGACCYLHTIVAAVCSRENEVGNNRHGRPQQH